MRPPSPLREAALAVPRARELDQVCDQFEATWQAAGKGGAAPRLEDYLSRVPESERPALLRELLVLDIDYRRRGGQVPQAGDYLPRFPTLDRVWLEQELASPGATANGGAAPPAAAAGSVTPLAPGQRLRCPHCHHPIGLADAHPDEVLCPACGGSFRVCEAHPTESTSPGRMLGKFQLLERVGVGAFGAVWKARDTQLDRIVALKIPHAGLLTEKDDLARFHREARAAAQLRHPGIVTVHEVVLLEGVPALAADFIEGVPLKDLLQTRRLTFRETALLMAEVAEALDYAHEMGLVHRDIKPANIMLDYRQPSGGDSPEAVGAGLGVGKPLVMDFGLALRPEADVTLTQEGHLGTPAYMSPEQAAGHGHQADRRSDVYSLGVVLYELLTGVLPFRGSKMMMLTQVLHEEPRPPRALQDRIAPDLETICLKALAKDPERRYVTARELADDLRRWLGGEPIRARPAGRVERTVKWVRRRPALAALLAVSVLALVGFVAGGSVFAVRLAHERGLARDQEGRAVAALAREEVKGYFLSVALARRELQDGQPTRALELLAAAPVVRRHWEWRYLQRLTTGGPLFYLFGIHGMALSPDGQTLASVSWDRTVKLWEAATGQELRTLPRQCAGNNRMAFSPDSRRLVYAREDGTACLWDVGTGRELLQLEGRPIRPLSVTFSLDGRWVAAGTEEGQVPLWDAATGRQRLTYPGHTGGVWGRAFSPDGGFLASGGADGAVKLWDMDTGQQRFDWRVPMGEVFAVAFSPDGQRLAAGSGYKASPWGDPTWAVWHVPTSREVFRGRNIQPVLAMTFSPDGRVLALGKEGGTIRLCDAQTGLEKRALRGHTAWVSDLAFSPDGQRLVSASYDRTAAVWDVRSGPEQQVLRGHTQSVRGLTFSPDGRRLASASFDQTIKLWDAATGHQLLSWAGHDGPITSLTHSPDGRCLASTSYDQTVKLWDAATGQHIHTLTGHSGRVWFGSFSPDGRQLASCSSDGTARLWDGTSTPFGAIGALFGAWPSVPTESASPPGDTTTGR